MKKVSALFVASAMTLALLSGCSGGSSTSGSASTSGSGAASGSEAAAFTPEGTVTWVCTSSAGGGSDIFSRQITEILGPNGLGLVDATMVVDNRTDGAGEIGRNYVATMREGDADVTLLTFNSGDLMPMCDNTDNRVENFTPLAVMAVDKQLMFKGEHAPYDTFADVIAAVEGGTAVTVGGSKGDDIATYEALLAELGFTEDQMPYITYDSTSDAITALLGGHVDIVISKPAASSQYVEADRIQPILALANERYTGNLADAPTLSEVGDYENVEVPVWRGVVGPANMSDAAADFWSDVLGQVAESEQWVNNYLTPNMLISNYMDRETATEYMQQYQADYLASIGKDA